MGWSTSEGLQQILLYRELGLGLDAIADVLEGQLDSVEALRRHHDWLVAEGDQAQWEADLVERLGERVRPHIAAAHEARQGMTRQDHLAQAQAWNVFDGRVVEAMHDGCAIDDPRVEALLDEHLAMLSTHRQPNAESYAGLGRLYVEHPEFRARYDERDPGLAEFLATAMVSYAPRLGAGTV